MPKRITQAFTIIGLFFGAIGTANAELPTSVTAAYQTYESALNARDFEAAQEAAFTAWQNAEAELGDAKTTGDLARNFADISVYNDARFSKTRKAYKRSIELADRYPSDRALNVKLNRTVSFSIASLKNDKLRYMRRDLEKLIKAAERANFPPSTALAEAYTLRALSLDISRDAKEIKSLGEKALAAFGASEDAGASPLRAMAVDLANVNQAGVAGLGNYYFTGSGEATACCISAVSISPKVN